jgi:putative CocE/NonD family hydrolase
MTAPEQRIDCGGGVSLIRGRSMLTRDGVRLVSDHYFPAQGGPHPVLLMRQPYGRDIASTVVYAHPVWFAAHGYHVIIQDVRGRGDSEGDFYPFRHEAEDGFDAVQWAVTLPESTGRVGMYGFSYQGLTQLLAAALQPPALRAIAPAMTVGDLYHGWFYHGGMFRLAGGIGWGTQMLRGDATRLGMEAARTYLERLWSNLGAAYVQAPYAGIAALSQPGLPTYYRDWIKHDAPGSYWSAQDISTRYEAITVPALHVAGLYDMFAQGSLDCLEALQQRAGTSEARANQYLVLGPWQHIPWSRQIGEQDLGAAAVLNTDELLLRWFNHWLKDDASFAAEPKVRYFSLGRNAWDSATAWPPAHRAWAMYLDSDGKANSCHGDGRLLNAVPDGGRRRDVVVVDPEVPVMAAGGAGAAPGPFRQNRLEAGNNVLVYRSAPLPGPVEVCGNPEVSLFVSASQPECDVVVKLTRIDVNDQAWNLCLGAARAARHFADAALEADSPREWKIRLEATACSFAAGERIGLEIAGTAFPLLDRSANRPGVAARDAGPANWQRVTLQIVHDADHLSCLVLPVTKEQP